MNKRVYKKNYGVIIEKIEQEYYIVKDFDAYKINEIGARIADLCNGHNSCEKIAEILSKKYNRNSSEIIIDVIEFIDSLVKQKLLVEAGK